MQKQYKEVPYTFANFPKDKEVDVGTILLIKLQILLNFTSWYLYAYVQSCDLAKFPTKETELGYIIYFLF